MAKTLDDLLGDIRQMLQDKRLPYRYDDATLLDRVNTAFRETKRIRPDAFILGTPGVDEVTTTDPPTYTTADLGVTPTPTAFPIDEIFYQPIVFHTVGTIELGDDQFAVDNRAMTLLAAFRASLIGV